MAEPRHPVERAEFVFTKDCVVLYAKGFLWHQAHNLLLQITAATVADQGL